MNYGFRRNVDVNVWEIYDEKGDVVATFINRNHAVTWLRLLNGESVLVNATVTSFTDGYVVTETLYKK